MQPFRFIDLFAGIGGFHVAAAGGGGQCVFASEMDAEACRAYEANYGIKPHGDITKIPTRLVPAHDMLCAGFPCQPFSIIGNRRGFGDIRGTLFFEIVRILQDKKPAMFVLENVKQLATHDNGNTLSVILHTLADLGYKTDWSILNALDYGVPQKRERTIIVGFLDHAAMFTWPEKLPAYKPLAEIFETDVDDKYYASAFIRRKRQQKHTSQYTSAIWHENKSGNISSYPYSCALRAGASYNYLLVNGERRLTPREMLRLQGFPDTFNIVCSDSQTRKQAGNAIPVPMIAAVIREVLHAQAQIEGFKKTARKRAVSHRRIPQRDDYAYWQMDCV